MISLQHSVCRWTIFTNPLLESWIHQTFRCWQLEFTLLPLGLNKIFVVKLHSSVRVSSSALFLLAGGGDWLSPLSVSRVLLLGRSPSSVGNVLSLGISLFCCLSPLRICLNLVRSWHFQVPCTWTLTHLFARSDAMSTLYYFNIRFCASFIKTSASCPLAAPTL